MSRDGLGIDPALTALSDSLADVLNAIQDALPEKDIAEVQETPSADPSVVAVPLRKLKKLLDTDDGEAADFIVEARPGLSRVLTGKEIQNLSELVGEYDFEAAKKCLSGICSRLQLDLGSQ